MWRLLKFQDRKYWFITIAASFSTFIGVIADLFVPALLAAMVPLIAYGGDPMSNPPWKNVPFLYWTLNFTDWNNAVIVLGVSMGVVSFIGLFVGLLGTYLASKSAVNIATIIRSNLFRKIQHLSSSNLDKFGTSSLLTRLTNDINLVQTMAFMTIRVMFRGPFLFVGGLIFSLLTSTSLSISLVIWLPLLFLAIGFASAKAGPLFKINQKIVDDLNTQSRESILGIRVIKSYNLESNQRVKYDEVNKRWNFYSIKAFKIISGIQPIVIFIANLATLIVLLIGKYMPNVINTNDYNSITSLQAFLQYQGYIVMGITISMMVLVNYIRSRASTFRINEILNEKPDIQFVSNGVDIQDGSIVFDDVNFKYHSASENILNNISFQINSGETIGIIGSTGSGKTSLVNLITRIYEPSTGNVIVGKKNVKELDTVKLRNSVGYVLQENILFAGTIKTNLLFGNENATDQEIDEAIDIACAKTFINNFDDNVNHRVEQRGKNLSGGQKQRLSIARTILRKPKIIILDDSTSALDTITDQTLRNNIRTKLKGTTTLIIAQKVLSIKDCDKILVLDKGKIVGQGKHKDLLSNCEVYKQIAESQLSPEELENA
ncbi:ABC transporter ATP-binding protein [Mycoplasmoides alvi]|uniref:ABC transporter ATP-binding protein n=1 Tax=Mycoplasmoides alvi TaxID=78580 RepID=UPI000697D148|nr:ABC transporter ATP-binding protein [Mycoplasmoides alvi]